MLIYSDNGFALRNALFGAVKLYKNLDPNKCFYSGYGISFDVCGTFSLRSFGFGKKVKIFSADMSSFLHIDNKKIFFNSW